MCGSAASKTPANRFAPTGTSLACLASGQASSTIFKRGPVFSQNVEGYRISCTVDDNLNPNQDCLNFMSYFCDPSKLQNGGSHITNCKYYVDLLTNKMSSYWQTWHARCDSSGWAYSNSRQLISSATSCSSAESALKQYAKYYDANGYQIAVSQALIDTGNSLLWDNSRLQ